MKRGAMRLFASFARSRWSYALLLAVTTAALIATAVLHYRTIDRELTDVALSRRASVALLASATLSEKFERLVDISVSLATRVRFRALVGEGKWVEASEILRDVPRDFPFIERLFLADVGGTLRADVPELPGVRGRNFSGQEWYQGVSRDWRPYVSPVYRRAAVPQLNVFAVAAPIRSASGEVVGILVLQMRAERLLEWMKAVEIGPQGFVYVVDSKGQIAFHSRKPGQGKIIDFSAAAIVQSVLRGEHGVRIGYDRLEGEDQISAYAPVLGFGWGVIAQQPTRAAIGLEARDDQLRLLLTTYGLTLLFFVLGTYLAARTVVQRRRAQEDRRLATELEQRVAERTAQLNAVVETANDAIISADGQGRIVYFNRGAERAFGYSAREAAGLPLTALMPQRFHEAHRAGFERFLSTGEPRVIGKVVELVARKRDGTEFPVELSLANWTAPQGTFFTAIVRDITERRKAEEALKKINEQLTAANKELESFSYSVSHDLRSPLRAIDGFARILTEDYGAQFDDEGRRLLGVVRDNSQKMGRLIDDLLAFSRLSRKPLSTAEIDMNRLVEGVVGELELPREKRPTLVLGALPPAHGDEVLLKQMWVNLLANAVKFSAKSERPVIEVTGRENGAEIVYCVKDNGAGFDMQYYDKLFGVFQRLHGASEFPGTGVGLAIVQRVVTRQGGRVWAEGRVGEGAAFYFSLPRRGTE